MATTDILGDMQRRIADLEGKLEFYERKTFGCHGCHEYKKRIDELETISASYYSEIEYLKDEANDLRLQIWHLEDIADIG